MSAQYLVESQGSPPTPTRANKGLNRGLSYCLLVGDDVLHTIQSIVEPTMKKLTTLLFSFAFSTAALAEPVPRFEEFLTIMREHNCELTYKDAMQVLV